MAIVENTRKCCMFCLYWHGCLVIAKAESFTCSQNYCDFFERNDKPTFADKYKKNDFKIPRIKHI